MSGDNDTDNVVDESLQSASRERGDSQESSSGGFKSGQAKRDADESLSQVKVDNVIYGNEALQTQIQGDEEKDDNNEDDEEDEEDGEQDQDDDEEDGEQDQDDDDEEDEDDHEEEEKEEDAAHRALLEEKLERREKTYIELYNQQEAYAKEIVADFHKRQRLGQSNVCLYSSFLSRLIIQFDSNFPITLIDIVNASRIQHQQNQMGYGGGGGGGFKVHSYNASSAPLICRM
jgi:hypothetical protein